MDRAGIDVQVLSALPPGAAFGMCEASTELAARLNDDLIEAAGRYPGRFLVLATLPLPHVEESLAELDRVSAHPLVRGVLLNADSARWTLDDARFEPIYATLAERGMPAVLHPAIEELPAAYAGWMLGESVGAIVSSTLAGLRLIFSGMLDRVPSLDLVIPHLGGTIPYLSRRLTDLSDRMSEAEHDLPHYLRNRIYYDSCSYHRPALQCAIETVGADRIMLGSDFPFRGPLDVCVRDIEESGLPDEARDAILGGTAGSPCDAVADRRRDGPRDDQRRRRSSSCRVLGAGSVLSRPSARLHSRYDARTPASSPRAPLISICRRQASSRTGSSSRTRSFRRSASRWRPCSNVSRAASWRASTARSASSRRRSSIQMPSAPSRY